MDEYRSGFISLSGRANVGKSTLMNRLVGSMVSITSHKPQTTRTKVLGVLSRAGAQLVFVDTPGIHRPGSALGELMVKEARSATADADIRLFMVSAADGLTAADREVFSAFKPNTKAFLVINKADAVKKTDILEITQRANDLFAFDETVPVSALRGDNTDVLLDLLEGALPAGPKFFPDDFLTDQPERVIWGEVVRGRALLHLRDEVPHGIAVEIMTAAKRDDRDLVDIQATIYCEKNTHKGIVIGKGGEMLKRIGAEARRDLERLIAMPVNLNLWVKVKKDWRDNTFLARTLGGFTKD